MEEGEDGYSVYFMDMILWEIILMSDYETRKVSRDLVCCGVFFFLILLEDLKIRVVTMIRIIIVTRGLDWVPKWGQWIEGG